MGLTRRHFLRVGGAGLAAGAALPSWLSAAPVRAFTGEPGAPLLIVVFLRGGADALHLAPPLRDRRYRRLRGDLALERPLEESGFSRAFGLHPALAPLRPVIEAGRLALVPAAGSPHPTRSHFEAQDFAELGTSQGVPQGEGWLARGLREVADESAFSALAIASRAPLALRGAGAFALEAEGGLGLRGASGALQRELERAYAEASPGDPVAVAGRHALAVARDFERLLGRGAGLRSRRPGRGGSELERAAEQVLRLEQAGLPLRALWLESGDWDTHTAQGLEEGRMARALGDLARAVLRLDAGLAPRRDYALVVSTEFGRTVRPNGSGGTDHGHGSALLVAGTRVRGGVHGAWPGLGEAKLHEGRDLPVATDVRSVLWELLRAQLGGDPPSDTFPGFEAEPLGLLRAPA